jgi:hypothetical protein
MGVSVQPVPTSPQSDGDRITQTIAAMRAQGATEHDVETYLTQVEGIQPVQDRSLSIRNLGRAFTQGATFGFGDELGLTSRPAEHAFQGEHPVADFLAKLAGGAIGPAAAVVAAPSLGTTLGGAALLGGATGALTGAGEANGSVGDRASGAAVGGLLGTAGGTLGYGLAKGVGAVAGKIADKLHPERTVAKGAASLLTPDVASHIAQVDALAPGGSSIATAAVPSAGDKTSRFLPFLRAVGASPKAGAQAEATIMGQTGVLDAARKTIGDSMDQLSGDVPITPDLRKALSKVRVALGAKTPNVPPAELLDVNPLGLEKSVPFAFDEEAKTLTIGELRDALSRLRFLSRGNVKRGLEANGIDTRNIAIARQALQSFLYHVKPDFAELDRNYSLLSNEMRQADKALKTVQRSRANYAANTGYSASAGSLGGSLPRGSHGVAMAALEKMIANRPAAADAVARTIVRPSGPGAVTSLLQMVPAPTSHGTPITTPATAALIPALRGLLFPQGASP